MAHATAITKPTPGLQEFVEVEFTAGREFQVTRRVGRKDKPIGCVEAGDTSGATLDAVWKMCREHADDGNAGQYRVIVEAGDGFDAARYGFRIADEDDEDELHDEAVSYRTLARDYRQFGLDMSAALTSVVTSIPKVLAESGKTAVGFAKASAEVSDRAAEHSVAESEVKIVALQAEAVSEQLGHAVGLVEKLIATGTKTAPSEGAFALLTSEQAKTVRSEVTLARLFLGEPLSGGFVETLVAEHATGRFNRLLSSLTDDQREKLVAHFGAPAELFALPEAKTDAAAATQVPRPQSS